MKAYPHDGFDEFGKAARRFLVGMAAFIGLFTGLLFLLGNLTSWVLDVMNVLH